MADSMAPLCSEAQFNEGAFKDLASGYSDPALNDILFEATRQCESETGRRLAPFTMTETHRATGMDPDEYADSANMPMDIYGSLGTSFAQSLGVTSLTRHCWLNEFPSRWPDLWAYSDVAVEIIRSYGGNQVLTPTQILDGPDDTGHIWFQLGLYLPIGSRVRVTYTGGYQTVPADLVRACKYMTAAIIVRELDPDASSHDPDLLREDAAAILVNYGR